MSNSHRPSAPYLLLALLAAGGATAQTPAALPQLDVATTGGTQHLVSSALDGLGRVTLLWSQFAIRNGSLVDLARGRRFSHADAPQGPDIAFEKGNAQAVETVANERGDSIVIWNRILQNGNSQGVLRRESPVLPALSLRLNHVLWDVAVDHAGNFVVIWGDGARLLGQRYNFNGSRRGPQFEITDFKSGAKSGLPGASMVAMNQRTGEFVVVWVQGDADGGNRRIFAHRFGFATGRQGGEFQVTPRVFDAGHRVIVDVGRAEDGSFVVAWSANLQFQEFTTDIWAQRFAGDGTKQGGEIVVAEDTPITDGYMRLAVGPKGQFVVAWDDGAPPLIVRAYRPDGTPAGPAREMRQTANIPFPGAPEPAFGFDGTFVLAWNDFIGVNEPDDDNWEINFQRFAAAPGVELCAFRNGRFRCDTNGGGPTEVDHVFAIRGGTPLLGDVDGDERDDYCLFRGTRFDCDSGHDYGAAEFTAIFGQPGDTPLLGDLDGDGRDDACVFRAGHFLCDTGHDGGGAELDIAFGQPGDRALLGDVDGDRIDEPCLAVADGLQCDTARNGGEAETFIPFVHAPGLVPLLADIDGDGRDDPCSGGNGAFLCDAAHDGGAYTLGLQIDNPGRPLIGNVDGI